MIGDDDRPRLPSGLESLLATPPLRLPGVLVFLLSTNKAKNLPKKFFDSLDMGETARSKRGAPPDANHRFMIGRAALRCILTTLDDRGVSEADWGFGTTIHGKPYIQSPDHSVPCFNLSYAEYFMAIAISRTAEIGVDIEVSHEIPRDERPWHLFSDDERHLLKHSPAEDFPNIFFRFWTLKEAIAKRTSEGFAAEFSDISIPARPVVDGLDNTADLDEAGLWHFHTCLALESKTVHLAVSAAPRA